MRDFTQKEVRRYERMAERARELAATEDALAEEETSGPSSADGRERSEALRAKKAGLRGAQREELALLVWEEPRIGEYCCGFGSTWRQRGLSRPDGR